MSDATYHPEQPNPWPRVPHEVVATPQKAADAHFQAPVQSPQKPADAPKPPPVVKEPTINERAQGLLSQVQDSHRHNAPITPWMLSELGAVVAHVTGNKVAAPQHLVTDARGLPTFVLFQKVDGSLLMANSAEEALAHVRSLPKDVQARPHWVAADKALVEATESVIGSDVSPAIRLFEAALAEDRRLDPKPVTIAAKPTDDTKKTEANMEAQQHDAAVAATRPVPPV
jgi:hypothetical protein